MEETVSRSIGRLLAPKSIAIIGANERAGYGGRFTKNLINQGYQGKIYPVNPTHGEVFGLPCYKSVSAIEDEIDLAVIIVKADYVVDTVRECAQKGVGSALIITAGFSEFDKVEGKRREAEIREIARSSGMRIVGPNCIGFANFSTKMWACSISSLPAIEMLPGHAALVSQSGATGFGPLLTIASDRRVRFKYIVTTGNETDLGMCDFIEYLLDEEDIKTVSVLIEGLKEPERFMQLAQKALQLNKRIIALKIGESEVGARAAASHTASMTGDMAVFNAMVKQYGVIKAEDYDELIELARITQSDKQLKGKRLIVMSHSGGISGFTGDILGKYGFEIPVTSEKTQAEIDQYLKGFGSPRNPLDLTGHMRNQNFPEIVRILEANEDVDGYVVSTHGAARIQNVLAAIADCKKPVFFNWTGSLFDEGIQILLQSGYSVSLSIRNSALMLQKVATAVNVAPQPVIGAPCAALADKTGELDEVEAKRLIKAMGIDSPNGYLLSEDPGFASADPSKKYAMKIVGKKILHKTDMGGVLLGLTGKEKIAEGLEKLNALKAGNPDIENIYLEEYCPDGLDLVLGIRRDSQYGHILMVGLGGIYTELFKMVSLRLLPVDEATVDSMLSEVKGLDKLLAGYRGSPALDRAALVTAITQICGFVSANADKVQLLEMNPVRVLPQGQGVRVLDCVFHVG